MGCGIRVVKPELRGGKFWIAGFEGDSPEEMETEKAGTELTLKDKAV
jgi:hypothetical protein